MSEANMARSQYTSTRMIARLLIIGTAVFWLWFGIGSTYTRGTGPLARLMHMPLPGGLFVLSMLVAWPWEGIGGVLLVLEGLVALALMVQTFHRGLLVTSSLILMCLTLALPLLAAGILFLMCWRQSAEGGSRHGRNAAGARSGP